MLSARKRWTTQRNLLILGVCLAVYHVVIYRPLSRATTEIDLPLKQAWSELLKTSPLAGDLDGMHADRIAAGLEEARDSAARLHALGKQALARIEPEPVVREKMDRPFQLIEFQGERQVRVEELDGLAARGKVGLSDNVADGFPEYTAGRRYPSLLWPQLAVAHHLVAAALQARVTTVSVVRLPPVQFHTGGTNASQWLVEIPAQIELAGPAPVVARLLEALPLRPEEIKARGLPEALPGKPVLLLRGLLLRKEARDKLDQVRLQLSVSGFVTAPRGDPE